VQPVAIKAVKKQPRSGLNHSLLNPKSALENSNAEMTEKLLFEQFFGRVNLLWVVYDYRSRKTWNPDENQIFCQGRQLMTLRSECDIYRHHQREKYANAYFGFICLRNKKASFRNKSIF